VKKNSFGLLELEMADLKRFWRKTPLGPLRIKIMLPRFAIMLSRFAITQIHPVVA
jgi:hypothetical protein